MAPADLFRLQIGVEDVRTTIEASENEAFGARTKVRETLGVAPGGLAGPDQFTRTVGARFDAITGRECPSGWAVSSSHQIL